MRTTTAENERLTRVGAGTPMGAFLRRHWVAALLSGELPERDGPPKAIRLLGEDLVAFRDSSGEVGILDLHCPHRGAALNLARNENCALQCIYHGWRIDRAGTVLATPNEPAFSRFKERIQHPAYLVAEKGGIIWAYLGPAGTAPPLPAFEWLELNEEHRLIEKVQFNCNWLQGIENSIDGHHTPYLHSDTLRPNTGRQNLNDPAIYDPTGSVLQARPTTEINNPKQEISDESYGFRLCALRRPLERPEHDVYARTSLIVAPWYYSIPPPPGRGCMPFYVPVDDEHTMLHNVRFSFKDPLNEAGIRKLDGSQYGKDLNEDFSHVRNRDNNWLQDRAAMPERENYSGIRGVIAQDLVALESMGPIYDRSREHLGSADAAIVHFREMLLNVLQRFEETGEIGDLHAGTDAVRSARAWQKVIPRETPWLVVDPRSADFELSST